MLRSYAGALIDKCIFFYFGTAALGLESVFFLIAQVLQNTVLENTI